MRDAVQVRKSRMFGDVPVPTSGENLPPDAQSCRAGSGKGTGISIDRALLALRSLLTRDDNDLGRNSGHDCPPPQECGDGHPSAANSSQASTEVGSAGRPAASRIRRPRRLLVAERTRRRSGLANLIAPGHLACFARLTDSVFTSDPANRNAPTPNV